MVIKMADIKKLISLENLQSYDTLVKKYIGDADAVVNAKSVKTVLVDGDNIKFYKKENATTADVADYTVAIASSDVDNLKKVLSGYTTEGSVKDAIDANATAISTEAERADAAEKANKKAIEDEVARATGAESTLTTNLSDEITRAKAAEVANTNAISAETTRATEAEGANKSAIEAEVSRATAAEGDLDTAVKAAQKTADDITTLVGFTAGVGEDDPKTVKAYVDAEVAKATGDASKVAEDLAAEVERATGAENTLDDKIDGVAFDLSSEISRATLAEEAIEDLIDAHKEAIDGVVATLVGDDANKSVRTIANEELAAQLIPESAKESLDTLEEIAAWIQNHPDDASAMNKAIEDLEALVGTLPEDIEATTVVGMIQELVSAEETRATGVEGGLNTRLEAVEEAVGEGGSVATQIQTAIEALDSVLTLDEGEDYVTGVTITDGKITAHTAGTFNFDTKGSAAAVQADLDNYKWQAASQTEINDLFKDETV